MLSIAEKRGMRRILSIERIRAFAYLEVADPRSSALFPYFFVVR
jgi:hypothetical protein